MHSSMSSRWSAVPSRANYWTKNEARKIHHILSWILFMVAMTSPTSSQDTTVATDISNTSPKQLEQAVVTDMLKIVDNKFDTLTTRITALERAVSNLQFFSIRQFRQMSASLQSTESGLGRVSKQVGQLEVDGRGMKIALSLLGRDVSELKTMTSDMLSELDSSIVYLNDNMEKQNQYMKTVVEDTVLRSSRETYLELSRQLDESNIRNEEILRNSPGETVNCSVDFSNLTEHVDLRFAKFKKEMHSNFVDLINAEREEAIENAALYNKSCNDTVVNVDTQKKSRTENSSRGEKHSPTAERKHLRKTEGQQSKSRVPRKITRKISMSVNDSEDSDAFNSINDASYDEKDEMVMEALYNMTTSVLQAVSYLRNTGQLLEVVVANTDNVMQSQANMEKRITTLQQPNFAGNHEFEVSNAIPGTSRTYAHSPSQSGCGELSPEVMKSIATVMKNGSQLLEVLTDLAQLSSVSLTQSTATLQDEVKRIEGIRSKMASTLLAQTSSSNNPLSVISNATEKTFKLVEAIASNTGWLPLIFHNVQHVQALANRSLTITTRTNTMIRKMQERIKADIDQGRESSLNNRIPVVPIGLDVPGAKDEITLDQESLETIYSTSLQLNRIMPALTKLLAEPDPLITLVGGGRLDQGRVEIYHMGQWGAICHQDLKHDEANAICRHLGFLGGISAGAGHFGPGSGVGWSFNASCIATSKCSMVDFMKEDTGSCSHEKDAGVICDHMLRIIPKEDTQERQNIGRLEMFHRGIWLPICGEGWSGYSARVACQQMGYSDGREVEIGEWLEGANSTWLGRVSCLGSETRLDACPTHGWVDTCSGFVPAGVRCL